MQFRVFPLWPPEAIEKFFGSFFQERTVTPCHFYPLGHRTKFAPAGMPNHSMPA